MRMSDWSSDVCSSDLEEEAGEVFEVADGDLQEVIHVAGQRVAGDDFVPLVDEVGEGGDGFGVVVVELDADEGLQAQAHVLGVDLGTVAGDDAVALQALHPAQAGRGRKVDAFGQLGVGQAAAVLEFGKRSEEHTSELQSLMRISYAVFCLT